MRHLSAVAAALAVLAAPATAAAHDESSPDLPLPGLTRHMLPAFPKQKARTAAEIRAVTRRDTSGSFELVGHSPLNNRGMNAALAVFGDYAYVGNRSDATQSPNAGVMVVDVSDPSSPEVVGQIGPPNEGLPGESSRELRILPDQGLLMVLNHACSELLHHCMSPSLLGASYARSTVKFYDIRGEHAAAPKLVATYLPSRNAPQQPHEFFIWNDPLRRGRVLMYQTTPTTSSATNTRENLIVTDISRAREGVFPEIAKWTPVIDNPARDNRLHSLTLSSDGRRAYLAYLGGGFLVADTSDFADARPNPQVRLVTPVENRVFWTNPGAHSAAKVPGKPYALVTDEVYGQLPVILADHGCPWGWVRMIDVRDETKPKIAAEYKLPVNEESSCENVPPDREHASSFSAHNPTLTRSIALVTWHGAGMQAIDISRPASPEPAAQFVPDPLPYVQTEDPALSSGRDKVVMWSFPIVKDGLIYVVDIRNGLYVLRYRGPHAREVARAEFLDGNSNSGYTTSK
jgi:LVIVD repeat-containing protein